MSTSASSFDTVLGGTRAMVATVASISLMPIVFLRRLSGTSICAAPDSSITSIALSGQLAVMDVAHRKLDRPLDRLVGVAELVIILEVRLQALENFDRILG